MWASSIPSSSSRSASHGPLRSLMRPVRTSVPVTTMPARALIGPQGTGALRSAAARCAPGGSRLEGHRLRCRDRSACARSRSARPTVSPRFDPELLAAPRASRSTFPSKVTLGAAAVVHVGVGRRRSAARAARSRAGGGRGCSSAGHGPVRSRRVSRGPAVVSAPSPPSSSPPVSPSTSRNTISGATSRRNHRAAAGRRRSRLPPPRRAEARRTFDLVARLVVGAVLLDQQLRVEPQHLGVRSQERLHEGGSRQHRTPRSRARAGTSRGSCRLARHRRCRGVGACAPPAGCRRSRASRPILANGARDVAPGAVLNGVSVGSSRTHEERAIRVERQPASGARWRSRSAPAWSRSSRLRRPRRRRQPTRLDRDRRRRSRPRRDMCSPAREPGSPARRSPSAASAGTYSAGELPIAVSDSYDPNDCATWQSYADLLGSRPRRRDRSSSRPRRLSGRDVRAGRTRQCDVPANAADRARDRPRDRDTTSPTTATTPRGRHRLAEVRSTYNVAARSCVPASSSPATRASTTPTTPARAGRGLRLSQGYRAVASWEYNRALLPDANDFAAIRTDVLKRWKRNTVRRFRGRLSRRKRKRTFRIPISLDGAVRIARGPRGTNFNLRLRKSGHTVKRTRRPGSRDSLRYRWCSTRRSKIVVPGRPQARQRAVPAVAAGPASPRGRSRQRPARPRALRGSSAGPPP